MEGKTSFILIIHFSSFLYHHYSFTFQMGFTDIGEDNQPVSFQQTFEQKRVEHREELQRKEDEMRQTFVLRVKEKETELKEVEKEVSVEEEVEEE